MGKVFVALTAWLCAAAPAHAAPTGPAACFHFKNISVLLDQALRPYLGSESPTADQTRIAVLALRNASAKTDAQLGAGTSPDVGTPLGGFAQAASDYADAIGAGDAQALGRAAAALDSAKASAAAACGA